MLFQTRTGCEHSFLWHTDSLPAPPAPVGLTVTELMFSSSLAVRCARTVPPCSMGHWHLQATEVAMCLLSPFAARCPHWHMGTHGHRELGHRLELVQLLGEGLVGTGDGESSLPSQGPWQPPHSCSPSPGGLWRSLALPEEHSEAEVREGAGSDLKGDIKVGD